MRLFILLEGQTEQEFANTVLVPHFRSLGIEVSAFVVQTSRDASGRKRRGGGLWRHWQKDLKRLSAEQKGDAVRFTTLFDLYGLPNDFPGLAEHSKDPDTTRRAETLEAEMAEVVGDYRFIPYLQRHEFEALVLAALDHLELLLDSRAEKAALLSLKDEVAASSPEDINDGEETAPSKRLEALIPSYRKTGHGPLVLDSVGLGNIRKQCPRFNKWLETLEALVSR